ncbi:MAG: hypothetical protein EOP53_10395 [Sphingobacteriales bacterium]|nr:MAG: hypothetical protein EOP53_10395 [Sphingobacteriales bacterium]
MAKAKILLLFILLFSTQSIFAQTYISPYSRYGLGDVNSMHLIKHRAMGGTSMADMDSTSYTLSNPASYAALKSFVLETGISGLTYDIKSNDKTYNGYDFQFPYLSFSLPLLPQSKKHEWGVNVALTPFSKTGYQSLYNNTLPINTVEYFNGTGGFSKFSIGSGLKLFKGFYVGANAGYLFGQQTLNHRIEFKDEPQFYRLEKSTKLLANGFVFDAGAIYKTRIGKTNTLQLGFTSNLPGSINAREEKIANTLRLDNDGVSDSVFTSTKEKGNINLPLGYGGGIQFSTNNALDRDREIKKDNAFTVAFDYYQRKWSEYRINGLADPIKDYSSFSGGFEWKPNSLQSTSYLRKIKYRFGGKIAQSIYNVNDVKPVDQSVSFGLGLPFSNRMSSAFPSYLDLTVEAGELKGVTDLNTLQRRYIIFSIGIHLSEASWYNRNKIE